MMGTAIAVASAVDRMLAARFDAVVKTANILMNHRSVALGP